MVIIGIGNVLQKDDGLGVYASSYLKANYTFTEDIEIINGGVEGIHLLNVLEENDHVVILDIVTIDDTPASIYAIPAEEIAGYGLNNGGAHEIGIIQCLDMLELQGKETPQTMLIGIVPQEVTFEITLSDTLIENFGNYISVVLQYLDKHKVSYTKNEEPTTTLEEIMSRAHDPSGIMI